MVRAGDGRNKHPFSARRKGWSRGGAAGPGKGDEAATAPRGGKYLKGPIMRV